MPPECAQYGDASLKVDVYAFGIVLYELISAQEAILKVHGSSAESKDLAALVHFLVLSDFTHVEPIGRISINLFSLLLFVSQFEEVLNLPDPKDELCKLVDPGLGDSYLLDSVLKMAQLAKVCTQEYPPLRPSMRSIVVALMTFFHNRGLGCCSFYENHALFNIMSRR